MPLRSTKSGQRQLVVVIKAFSNTNEPSISFKLCTLYISVTPSLGSQQGECPPVFRQTGRKIKQNFVITIITHSVGNRTTLLSFGSFSNNINRTTYCRRSNLGSTQTTLYLNAPGNIGQTWPVWPIYLVILHTVHGHTINHHSRVFTLETTNINLTIPKATTVFSSIYTRSRFQDFRKFLCT